MASRGPNKNYKARRSWFDTPPLTTLDPLPVANAENISKRASLDVVEILTLTHFTNPPKVIFGKAIIGRTKIRTLLLRNPHDFEQEVIIEKFPYKKKFMVNQTRFTVRSEEVFSLEITWTPEEDGGYREMIQFHVNDVYRLQAFVIGTANKPKPLARKIRKFPIAPCLRQAPTVLQTPALTNIRKNYSPTCKAEAYQELDDLVPHRHKDDKENSESRGQQYQCTIDVQDGCVLKLSNQASTVALNKIETHTKVNNEEVAQTPNPLESTTIVAQRDQKTKRQWRHISDITSPTLNMSPIPVSEGNEHGLIVDSYFQANEINTAALPKRDKLLMGKISKNVKKTSAEKLFEGGYIKETFVRPLPQFENKIGGKSVSGENNTTEDCTNRQLVSSLRPQFQQIVRSDETRIIQQHEAVFTPGYVQVVPEPSELHSVIMSPELSGAQSMNEAESRRSPPKLATGNILTRASEISPRTMLDESLTMISQMVVQARSTYTSPKDNDTSVNSSLISQGQGIVSPNSFMEDMRSMVRTDDSKCNNTANPDVLSSSLILNNSIHRKIMTNHFHDIRLRNSPFVMNIECGTPKKSQVARFGSNRRSITSQFQKEEIRKIAAAASSVIKDKELLLGTHMKTKQGRASMKDVMLVKKPVKGSSEHAMLNQSPSQGISCLKKKEKVTKRTPSKRSPFGKRSLLERRAPLTKSHLNSLQDVTTKRTRNKLCKRNKSMPLKPFGEVPNSQQASTTNHSDRSPSPTIIAKTETDEASSDHCNAFTFVTPQKENAIFNSNSETHCRSIDSGTVTKVKSLENTAEISGRISNCLFQDEQRMELPQNVSPKRQKLFPDIHVADDMEVDISHGIKEMEESVDTSQIVYHDDDSNKVEEQVIMGTNNSKQQCQDTDALMFDNMAVADPRSSPSENVCSEAETPQKFSALSTSPAISLDNSKRATITLSKSRFSDALTTALNSGKKLFQHSPKIQSSCCITTDDTETQENIRVDVEEHYQEIDGNMYVIVKETTNVTKSTTETYMEHLTISPHQFQTPTRLPNSPDHVMTRRSTHVVRSPKVINVASFNKRQIDFIAEREESSHIENYPLKELASEHLPELTEEGNNTPLIVPHENSDMKSFKINCDTFEKESTFLATPIKHLLEDKSEHPITSVCAMSSGLVDYENGSESGNSLDVTMDSLDTNQSLDSLVNSVAQTSPCLEESKHRAELETNIEEKSISAEEVERCIALFEEELHQKCVSKSDCQQNFQVPEPQINNRNRGKLSTIASDESEDEQFYDTMSETYYDALSGAVVEEVSHLQETAESENHQRSISCDSSRFCDELNDKWVGVDRSSQFEVRGHSVQNCISAMANEEPPAIKTEEGMNLNWTEQTLVSEMSVDHREQFEVTERKIFNLCSVSELKPVDQIIRSTPEAKIKRKLRRSISADNLLETKLSTTESDIQKCSKTVNFKSSPLHMPKHASFRKIMTHSKSAVSAKCAMPSPTSFSPTKIFHGPSPTSPRIEAATKLRSQSLSNLSIQTKKSTLRNELHTADKKGAVIRDHQAVSKQKVARKAVAPGRLILVKKKSNAGIPRHPMLFAAKNMYYDERWMEKQERGFVQWLNFVLTPPDEYVAATNKTKIDAGSLSLDINHGASRLAPTKEKLSFRSYAARRRLNRLRRSACELYQSELFVNIICKIEVEVESRRICVRKDKMVHADVGIKQRLLDLLLNYSSLWLRVGLETIFGEVLMLQSNQDVVGLSKFILNRLLASPDIAAEFAHPTVPHLYKQGYIAAVSRHIVKKLLLLVYFLDQAKSSRLIDHDPCLFCKDAGIKSSREILIEFSREVLSGEGDITRHLAYLGYTVFQSQKPIEEFDFAVVNLSSDLRDGMRLCRVLELLAGDHSIMKKLRAPAVSRLQKVHNTGVFFKGMCERGLNFSSIPGTVITAKDIADGHREKTLALLWQMIIYFQGSIQVNEAHLKEEMDILMKSLQLKVAMQKIGTISMEDCEARRYSGETKLTVENKTLELILQWCRLVCLHYGVKVENFTVSFSDGRALCCLVHHYHPALLPLSEIHFQTTISSQEIAEDKCQIETNPDLSVDWGTRGGGLIPEEDNPEIIEQLLTNEKTNYRTLFEKVSALGGVPLMLKFSDMSNTIPSEKVVSTFVSYLCARLLDIREEARAARTLQMVWRKKQLLRALQKRQMRTRAAVTIQRWVRPFLVKHAASRKCCAATYIQSAWRGHCARIFVDKLKLKKQEAFWKESKEESTPMQYRSAHQQEPIQEKDDHAVITIQSHAQRLHCRRDFLKTQTAAIKIQSLWRRHLAQKTLSSLKVDHLNHSATVIQKWMKRHNCMCRYRKQRAAVISLQLCWRRRQALHKLHTKEGSQAATTFDRTTLVERDFHHQSQAAVVLQTCWRRKQTERQLALLKSERENKAAVLIQSVMKCVLCRQKYLKLKQTLAQLDCLQIKRDKAAVVIQKYFRGYREQSKFHVLLRSTIIIQSRWRMLQAKKTLNQKRQEHSALVIQQCYRRFRYRQDVQKRTSAVLIIQKLWRTNQAKKIILKLHRDHQVLAAVTIQKHYRGFIQRRNYVLLKSAVTVVEKYRRIVMAQRHLDKLRCQKCNKSALVLQKNIRMWKHIRYFQSLKSAATVLQNTWRMVQSRRFLLVTRQVKSAILIQKVWRGYVARQIFISRRAAALKIQATWRMIQTRKQFWRLKKAAACIKVWLRSCMETKWQRSVYWQQRKSVIYIQSWWRCHTLAKKFQTMRLSAVCIQRSFRAYHCRHEFLTKKCAARTIQRGYRHYCEGVKARKEYLALRHATIIIQKSVRRYLLKKQMKLQAAALVLQTAYRKTRSRRQFVNYKLAALTIQTRFRAYIQKKNLRQHFLHQRQATCVIQRAYKAHVIKRQYLQFRHSIIKLQSYARSRIARSHFKKQKNAAIVIQRKFRAFKISHEYREAFLQLRTSAIIIQRFYRAWLVQTKMACQHSAATKIQARYRSWHQRRDYLHLQAAAVCFQRRYRAHLTLRNRLKEMTQSACIIQRRWRLYKQVRDAKERAQQLSEKLKARQEEEKLFNERKEMMRKEAAAALLKRSLRAYMTLKSNARRQQAALVIQKHIRGYLSRRRYHTKLKHVLHLQHMIRGFACRRRYERIKLASRIIQSRWREILEGRQCRSEYIAKLEAVAKIQAYFLMRRHRKIFLVSLTKVVIVQSFVRAFIQRHRFKKTLRCIVGMQRKVKGNLQMRQDRERFLKFRHCAIKIQTVVRLWLAYRRVQARSDFKMHTYLRMSQQPLALHQTHEVIQVQKSLLKCQQLDTVAKEAALMNTESSHQKHLQNCHVGPRNTVGARIIQRTVQCFLNKCSLEHNNSASVIQRALRTYVFRRRMIKTHCATVLQTSIRLFLSRRCYLAKQRSVVMLQAAVRGWHARRWSAALKRQKAAVCLQACIRGFLIRKKLSPMLKDRLFVLQEQIRQNRAATKIQTLWRGYVTCRNIKDKKLTQARKRLQEVSRGATSEKTLGSRTSSALDYLLRERDLAQLLESLMHLEVSTRLSPKCCEKMVEVNAVSVLYRLINSCNRSIPHMELIKYSVNILLNLAKYEKTIAAVIEPQESISTIVELLQIYREKGSIFTICCMLLWVLALHPSRREFILKHPVIVDRLQSLHVLALRKQRTSHNRQAAQAKMAAVRNVNCSLPALTPSKCKRRRLHPDWTLAGDSMKEFEDPAVAVSYVMDVLQIRPKI